MIFSLSFCSKNFSLMFFLYCPISCLRKLLLLKPIRLIKPDEYFRGPWKISRRGPGRFSKVLLRSTDCTAQRLLQLTRGPNPITLPSCSRPETRRWAGCRARRLGLRDWVGLLQACRCGTKEDLETESRGDGRVRNEEEEASI